MPWLKPGGRMFYTLAALHVIVGSLGTYFFNNILLGVFSSGLVLTLYLWGVAAVEFVKNPRRELWGFVAFGFISVLPFITVLLVLQFPHHPWMRAEISLIAAAIGLFWLRSFRKQD